MIEHIEKTLREECRLSPDLPVLVAVSGGPDSLCMLDLIWRSGYPVIVAHLNHGLRAESADEARAVQEFAQKIGAPFCLGAEDVKQFSETHTLSIEEAARSLRYKFLFERAQVTKAQAVAVGHTADDQVETVLMHLLRGAGLSGLKGMQFYSLPNPWSRQIPLVRPLLGTWREEITAYIAARGLQPAFDASNLDTRFYRNRLRHELIPLLESYNPGVRLHIWHMAELLGQDHAMLETAARAAWQECVRSQGAGYIGLDVQAMRLQPVAIQRQVLRQAIQELRPGLRNIDYAAIERARNFLERPTRDGQSDLVSGLRLQMEGCICWLAGWEIELPLADGAGWPRLSGSERLSLAIPGAIQLADGWRLSASPVDIRLAMERGRGNADPFQAWMDADSLVLPLQVRARQPGDRFQPLGMHGRSIKLSDFMVNVKLPRRARPHWPLVVSGGTIVWVPGQRLAHSCRLTESSQKGIHLSLLRES